MNNQSPTLESPAISEWCDFDFVRTALNRSVRATREVLAQVPDRLRQSVSEGRGRPQFRYHYSAHPALAAAYESALRGDHLSGSPISGFKSRPSSLSSSSPSVSSVNSVRDTSPSSSAIAPDDLAIARLRARAVREYRMLRHQLSEAEAARITCDRWAAKPASVQVATDERIGRHTRKQSIDVSVGDFSTTTLRRWTAQFKAGGILALAPDRKQSTGRSEVEIPADILTTVRAAAISTSRADIKKAVAFALSLYKERAASHPVNAVNPVNPVQSLSPDSIHNSPVTIHPFPSLSLSTWRRRILAADPSKALATLGKRGVSAFRLQHSGDIERDWSKLRHNQLWQLDDVQEDFYGHASDPLKLIRPYAYVIMRVATRKWICGIACETPIVKDQVRAMIGYAMQSRRGGVPEEIAFERGAVACDDYLESLLTDLGVKVHRTSMDGGATAAGAVAGRAIGHFQGKGVIEGNIRGHHNILWDTSAQVGTEERHTAPQNTEALKALAISMAKEGKPLILPTPAEWQARIFAALETHNDAPHSGLPEIIDSTGERRHMSPNEMEAHLGDQPMKIMPEQFLMMFLKRGVSVPVTRNGVLVNGESYGRFDEDLQKLAGTKVLVHAIKDFPDLAYVAELGRCITRYQAAEFGATDEQFEQKRSCEKTRRSEYETLMAQAAVLAPGTVIDVTRFTRDATPTRPVIPAESPALLERVNRISDAVIAHKAADAALNERFSVDRSMSHPVNPVRSSIPLRRRGLLSREDELTDQLQALGVRSFSDPSDLSDVSDMSDTLALRSSSEAQSEEGSDY